MPYGGQLRLHTALFALVVSIVTAPAALAADAGAEANAIEEQSHAPIIVTATRVPTALLGMPASVTMIDEKELDKRNVVRLGDALADVPGLYIRGAAMGANFPGTGQAVISLRGIPRTPRTLVLIDGQPVNNALTGGVNVAGIPFESVQRIEVVRGPYSALYGGNAMGGAVNFITAGPDQPIAEIKAGVGNLWQRAASVAYRDRFANGIGVTLSLGWRASDGYGDSDYVLKRVSAGTAGKPVTGAIPTTTPDGSPRYWVGTMGARPWWQVNGQAALHYAPDDATEVTAGMGFAQYSVGYSRPDSFLRDSDGNPVYSGSVIIQDGTTRRLVVSETDFFTFTPSGERDLRPFLRVERHLSEDTVLRLNAGALWHMFRYTTPKSGVATYESGPGELTYQPSARIDVDLSVSAKVMPGWTLTAGAAFNRSTMDRKTRALSSWRDWGTDGAILTEGIGRATSFALFAQSEHELLRGLDLYAGARFDHYATHGRVIDNGDLAFDETYETRKFHQLSPKVALVWKATPWLSLRTSYGQGFRPPALLDMYSLTVPPTVTAGVPSLILPAPDLRPERVRSLEAGADVLVADGGNASVTFYRQRLTDLIYRQSLVPGGNLSRNANAGAASIDGVEANLRWRVPIDGLKLFAAMTHHFRYEITRNDASPATVGKVLTDVPRTTWSAGLEYERGPWSGLAVVRHTSHVFGSGNDMNTNIVEGVYGSYDTHTVVSARIARRIGEHLTLSISGDNLTNRQYFIYSKQPGRSVFAEAAWRF